MLEEVTDGPKYETLKADPIHCGVIYLKSLLKWGRGTEKG